MSDDGHTDIGRLEWTVKHDAKLFRLDSGWIIVWWDGEDYIESAQHETWRDAIDAAMAARAGAATLCSGGKTS